MSGSNTHHEKYHALIIDSGAIIKQTSFSNTTSSNTLLNAANHYYTVPAVLSEIRDAKSRAHLTNFTNLLSSLHNNELVTRTPTQHAIQQITNFSKKTGDYSQLSVVDLQVLALLYDLEMEAAGMYNNGNMKHVRDEPKRVLGVSVKALNGDGKRRVKSRSDSVSSSTTNNSSVGAGSDSVTTSGSIIVSNTSFFQGDADGIIDASNVDLEYDYDEEEGCANKDNVPVEEERQDSASGGSSTTTKDQSKPKVSSWATVVNPTVASSVPLVDYSIGKAATSSTEVGNRDKEPIKIEDLNEHTDAVNDIVDGQFDDASSSSSSNASNEVEDEEDTFSSDASTTNSNGEIDALNIANATSDDEFSDEECDVFILEPHEALYLKKLKEQKKKTKNAAIQDVQDVPRDNDIVQKNSKEEDRLASEFPSLSVAATVPYEGCSDDEEPIEFEQPKKKTAESQQAWEKEEEERKMKALQPMVNGRIVKNGKKQAYNSFRKYGNVVSANGAAVAMKKVNKVAEEKGKEVEEVVESVLGDDMKEEISTNTATDTAGGNAYKSRILGAANAALASSSNADGPTGEMTAEDDDGEGWVTCTRDIQSMKATGSLHLNNNSHSNNNERASKKKDIGPPISQRAACATTDFAMQNVILQMNLELLSVDGVRVRRLKTWVTRCAACFTIYGSDHGNKSSGGSSSGRLFCDKCGSNTLQRISASVDRDTGRLKLHMKKNYQYNTRGTKFSLPKAGKGNKYEGDILLAEDQLLYGAWNQKVRKGKSKASSQSIFGSDLASDLGCITDLTKRDDIRVGFGRKNPNSTKFGRERRGKKKKGVKDKACGLRRY